MIGSVALLIVLVVASLMIRSHNNTERLKKISEAAAAKPAFKSYMPPMSVPPRPATTRPPVTYESLVADFGADQVVRIHIVAPDQAALLQSRILTKVSKAVRENIGRKKHACLLVQGYSGHGRRAGGGSGCARDEPCSTRTDRKVGSGNAHHLDQSATDTLTNQPRSRPHKFPTYARMDEPSRFGHRPMDIGQ